MTTTKQDIDNLKALYGEPGNDSMSSSEYRKWYGTQRWKRRRAAQLAEEPLCRFCAEQGRTVAATVADHVEPHRGDEEAFFSGELQSLCAHCHSAVKASMERSNKPAKGCDANGIPISPDHPWGGKQK